MKQLSDWTRFLQQHHNERRNRDKDASFGDSMKSASKLWKKQRRTMRRRRSGKFRGGEAEQEQEQMQGGQAELEQEQVTGGKRRRRRRNGTQKRRR